MRSTALLLAARRSARGAGSQSVFRRFSSAAPSQAASTAAVSHKPGASVGLVGLANVGKSSLFNALVGESKALVANYPFATIKPNVAIVSVPDPRLNKLAEVAKSKRIISTFVEVHDIAGLIKGAADGAGLGNEFLGNIRAVDAIAHVVRCFNDPNILHVLEDGARDPITDLSVVNLELILADLTQVEKRLMKSKARLPPGEVTELNRVKDALSAGQRAESVLPTGESATENGVMYNSAQVLAAVRRDLLTAKPMLYVLICDSPEGDDETKRVQAHLESEGAKSVVVSPSLESQIASETDPESRAELAKEFGMTESTLERLAVNLSSLLRRRCFFTVGPQEARAWVVGEGESAVRAAARIHSDIADAFVCADVVPWEDYGTKPTRMEGKAYVVKDGDVIVFKHR